MLCILSFSNCMAPLDRCQHMICCQQSQGVYKLLNYGIIIIKFELFYALLHPVPLGSFIITRASNRIRKPVLTVIIF